jgi:aspartyl/asparaginyl beta-hydroxylase (cupin superfamily)
MVASTAAPDLTATAAGTDELIAFLRERGAGTVRHAHGRTLLDHLAGTHRICEAWRLEPDVARAALFHSVYGTSVFRHQNIPVSDRRNVAELAGAKAERLAYLFCRMERRSFLQRLYERGAAGRLVVDRHDGTGTELIEADESIALVLLLCANEAEQSQEPDGAPGGWLANVARMAGTLPRSSSIPPALRDAHLWGDDAADRARRETYRDALRILAEDPARATALLRSLAEGLPALAEPNAWLAYLALASGQIHFAQQYANRAAGALDAWGTAWDKRLSVAEWSRFIGSLRAKAADAWAASDLGIALTADTAEMYRSIRAAGDDGAPRAAAVRTQLAAPDRFARFLDRYARGEMPAGALIYPDVASQPWFDPAQFPITEALEENCARIADEVRLLRPQMFHREAEALPRRGDWDVLMLYERGRRNDENCEALPTATRIVEEFETLRTLSGLIYVSRLSPGTHIAPHRGPTNIRLRCHLPLEVPEGECGIRVGDITRRWEPGRCLVFDDYYRHEAWNEADTPRIVLILDLWHPDLRRDEIERLTTFQNQLLQNAANLMRYWGNNARARDEADKRWM